MQKLLRVRIILLTYFYMHDFINFEQELLENSANLPSSNIGIKSVLTQSYKSVNQFLKGHYRDAIISAK